jgi:hypothetical protein
VAAFLPHGGAQRLWIPARVAPAPAGAPPVPGSVPSGTALANNGQHIIYEVHSPPYL